VYSTKSAGFNLNKGDGKINSYFNYQFTDKNNFEELDSKRIIATDNSTLDQKAYTTYPSFNHYLGAGVDINFTNKFSADYDIRFSGNDNRSSADNFSNIITTAIKLLPGAMNLLLITVQTPHTGAMSFLPVIR